MPALIDHLAVIRAQGPDAAAFLHNQLSNDFLLLPTGQWQLAAYCNPQGRMLASFWGIKLTHETDHQDIALVVSKDIAPATLKRLSMFVLRAKVSLQDDSNLLPELLTHHGLTAWIENEVKRGVARLTAPLVNLFIPQMLNYESINGISFKKGCYPGQEVIARSQFRGAIKRKTYLAQIEDSHACASSFELLLPGQNIYVAANTAPDAQTPEAIGVLLQTEVPLDNTHPHVLICLQTQYACADLRLASPSGMRLKILDLPYALRQDI